MGSINISTTVFWEVFTNVRCNCFTHYSPAHRETAFFELIRFFFGSCKQVAGFLVKRAQPKAVFVVKLILTLLSFRLGTLLLCGYHCLDWKWPFIHKFSEIPVERREIILKKWSRGKFLLPPRVAFVMIKVFCLYIFFSRVIVFSNQLLILAFIFFLLVDYS